MGSAVCELLWISYLLKDFNISVSSPISLHCDNQVAIHITVNHIFHERTKHLDIDCHIVRYRYKLGLISPIHVSSSHQLKNIFTKLLSLAKHHIPISKLGPQQPPTCREGMLRLPNSWLILLEISYCSYLISFLFIWLVGSSFFLFLAFYSIYLDSI